MIIIYKHRNKINGKVYIGQTNNIKKRWMPSRYKRSPLFYKAIQKYGWDNFTHEVLSEIEDQNEADNQEISLIEYFDSTNPEKGYNIVPGGGINTRGMTFKRSEETKKKISLSHSGANHYNYNKHLSKSHRDNLSESLKINTAKGENHYKSRAVYLIDTIDGWDEYYPCIKDICKKYPDWNYKSIKQAACKDYLFKKRYKIEYIEGE